MDNLQRWIESMTPTEPDAGGQVGRLPVGAVEFLREVYERHGGPVPPDLLRHEREKRELDLIRAGVELVLADVHRTTALRPVVRVMLYDDWVPALSFDGNIQTPVLNSLRTPESVRDVADNMRDHVVDELWTVWPVCPDDGSGLDPRAVDGEAVWFCRVGDHVVSRIGDLGRRVGPTCE